MSGGRVVSLMVGMGTEFFCKGFDCRIRASFTVAEKYFLPSVVSERGGGYDG